MVPELVGSASGAEFKPRLPNPGSLAFNHYVVLLPW